MKKIVLATAFSLAATATFAGGMAEPVTEPAVVEAKSASSSSAGIIIPILLVVLIAAAAAN